MVSSTTKFCSRCKENRSLEEFNKNKRIRDGLSQWCRRCKREDLDIFLLARGRKPRPWVKVSSGYKHCPKCKAVKLCSEFTGIKRLSPYCRNCMYSLNTAWRRSKGDKERVRRTSFLVFLDLRECFHCDEVLPTSKFSRSPRGSDGLSAYCKECMLVRDALRPKEKVNNYAREWRKNNPVWAAQHRRHQQARRARKARSSTSEIDQEEFNALYNEETCLYCDRFVPREHRTVDHVVPLVRGGAHAMSNLVMACGSCNFSKHKKPLEVFIQRFTPERQQQILTKIRELPQ